MYQHLTVSSVRAMADLLSADNLADNLIEHPEVEQVCRNGPHRQQMAERIIFVIMLISDASAMLLV
jgi:hypothetical protein